jgi:hypothetical protein
MARPQKNTFPIGHEEMLRLVLPKKRVADRMKIFREWARSNLAVKLWRRPTDEEAQADFELWCKYQWKDIHGVHDTAQLLKNFLPNFSAYNRKKRAVSGAAARWQKGGH